MSVKTNLKEMFDSTLALDQKVITEESSKKLLSDYGIKVPLMLSLLLLVKQKRRLLRSVFHW